MTLNICISVHIQYSDSWRGWYYKFHMQKVNQSKRTSCA